MTLCFVGGLIGSFGRRENLKRKKKSRSLPEEKEYLNTDL